MYKCPRCSREFNSFQSLSKHTNSAYKLRGEELYREINNITEIPLCECGCGQKTKWRSDRGYAQFVNGHNARGESNPMYGKTHTTEARHNISQRRKEKFANGEYDFINTTKWSEAQKKVWTRDGYREKMKHLMETTDWRKKMSKSKMKEKNPWYGKKRPEHSKLMKSPEMLEKIFAKRSATDIEILMAEMLEQIGVEYHSQFFINHGKDIYSYDFKIKGAPILIEVDGDYWHGGPSTDNHVPFVNEVKEKDALKNKVAEENGYKVLRFWGSDIIEKPFWIVQQLLQHINQPH